MESIENAEQYNAALKRAEYLVGIDPAQDSAEGRELDALATLIEKYAEAQLQFPFPPIEIDEFHRHEFMDRTHCISEMVATLLRNHVCGTENDKAIELVEDALGALYQEAAAKRAEG